nr:unnamed protein product [Digitaria exilis]
MAVTPPPPRFQPSLHLQDTKPNPSPSRSTPRPAATTETLRRRLLRRGVSPTPKILHALRKKEALKALRRARKDTAAAAAAAQHPCEEALAVAEEDEEETRFRAAAAEYRALVGRPWDGAARGVALPRGGGREEEGLEGLKEMLVARRGDGFRWLLDDDIETEAAERKQQKRPGTGWDSEAEDEDMKIQLLVTRMMKKADLIYNEDNLLRILDGLEAQGNWRQALAVTEWVYNENSYRHRKSRFVYTKLLSILGKSLRATEALRVFTIMRGDAQIYPDMPAYHSIAVTLGRAGLLKELIKIIEYMRQKPSKKVMKMRRKDWDPSLEPDVLIYNSVLNACVLSQQWKGVFWVFQQMRISGVPPTGATFGLAMEVMLKAKKYDFVQKFYEKMQKNGVTPRAITYKGNIMFFFQVHKLKQLPLTKPLEYTFTGMILASFNGGHFYECISIFESMKDYCSPNIGAINAMLKVYGRCDMFGKAKDLFETTRACFSNSQTFGHEHSSLTPDAYTYSCMLEASASAQQWEYFEYVYREMALSHHYLDQSKYSWLLIKACRAGKSYLLEHALDSILERAEIPDAQLIVELICQSTAQRDYGRVLQLLNIMTEASIKINEVEWANILQQNVHQFSVDALQDIIKYLSSSGSINADPALSFVKALGSQCETTSMKSTCLLVDGSSTRQCECSLLVNEGKTLRNNLTEQDQLTDTCKNLCTNEHLDVPHSDRDDIPQLDVAAVMSRDISLSRPRLENINGQCDLGHWGPQVSAIDEVLDSMSSYGDSSYREMPSASEILELWEQERMNDVFDPKAESKTTLIRGL